jgi:hypothetical protein
MNFLERKKVKYYPDKANDLAWALMYKAEYETKRLKIGPYDFAIITKIVDGVIFIWSVHHGQPLSDDRVDFYFEINVAPKTSCESDLKPSEILDGILDRVKYQYVRVSTHDGTDPDEALMKLWLSL